MSAQRRVNKRHLVVLLPGLPHLQGNGVPYQYTLSAVEIEHYLAERKADTETELLESKCQEVATVDVILSSIDAVSPTPYLNIKVKGVDVSALVGIQAHNFQVYVGMKMKRAGHDQPCPKLAAPTVRLHVQQGWGGKRKRALNITAQAELTFVTGNR